MTITCAWCQEDVGTKDGEGTTHTVCEKCYQELVGGSPQTNHPPKSAHPRDMPYPNQPDEYKQGKMARPQGNLLEDCMYEDNTMARRIWMLGWSDQNERMIAKEVGS